MLNNFIFIFLLMCGSAVLGDISADGKWKKKDVRDYTDADIERLFEQWEDADEPLEDDELPEWKRPQEKIDMTKLDPEDPEGMMKQSKSGRTLMMFVSVSGNPTEAETQELSQLWQSSLFNAHYELQRYVVGSDRVLFTLKDGSKAWEIKDFLIKQDRCLLVTIEGKDYFGKGHPSGNLGDSKYPEEEKPKKKNDSDKKKKKKKKKKKEKKEEDNSENETIKTRNEKIEL